MTMPAGAIPVWEVYAVRYATVARTVHGNFLYHADLRDGPMPLDFYMWFARDGASGRVVAVDTGFNGDSARRRGRVQDCTPEQALAALGMAPGAVADVVITHLHYDHAGNIAAFPRAAIHLQADELHYATGPCMSDPQHSHFYEVEDIAATVAALYGARLRFHEGDGEIAPGLTVHRIGGHTAGLQAVRIHTARGWIVLASDAAHYYANKARRNPFPAIHDLAAMLAGFDRLDALADGPDHIIPGHDPQVRRIYPALANLQGVDVACLHLPPLGAPACLASA